MADILAALINKAKADKQVCGCGATSGRGWLSILHYVDCTIFSWIMTWKRHAT